jgi:hypothetical protein
MVITRNGRRRPAMPLGEFACASGDRPFSTFRANNFLYTYGHIAARCIGLGQEAWKVSAIYLEFDNSGISPASPPAYDLDEGIEYYDGLASSVDRDYVRVPLDSTPSIVVAPGYESLLAPDRGNRIVCSAQTSATQGAGGKPFTAGAGSVVFGLALAATPAPDDPAADVLLARGYYATDQQVPKVDTVMRTQYRITFGP